MSQTSILSPTEATISGATSPDALRQRLHRAEQIIAALHKGVAILNAERVVGWVNTPFLQWCPQDPIHRVFPEVFGEFQLLWPDRLDLTSARPGQVISARILHESNQYLDITVTPYVGENDVLEMVVLCTDVTSEVVRQQKLDALHRAGQELAAFDPGQLRDTVECRVEVLKQNLRRIIHDLLEYDVIEIRLLNPLDGKLEPLLEEGMTSEAASRVLYARTEDNGVTGFVAATGKSYLCADTTNDSHYLPGAVGARSSMTVPLIFQDEVIGTFNVESPKPNAFGMEELQFAELFSREIANALHTLNLLSEQRSCTATEAIEAVNREIALTGDELLSLASQLLKQFGDQPVVAAALQRILVDTRTIKESIQHVGEDFARKQSFVDGSAPTNHVLRGMRVLVINSDNRIRRSAHTILEKLGAQVETAGLASEGLALASTGVYDAVLVAVRHTDMGGTAVYQDLVRLQPNGRVILTQGFEHDGGHTVVNARLSGYRYPVLYSEPFQVNQIVQALTREMPPDPGSSGSPVR